MNSGRKPSLTLPPRVTAQTKLDDLERAADWAVQPALDDAKAAVDEDRAGEGEAAPFSGVVALRGLEMPKPQRKNVGHLLKIPADLNARLEIVLNHISGRPSKQKFILTALEQYVLRAEAAISRSKAG